MAERNLNFDEIIERHNTNSLKYDTAAKNGLPEDVLPLWVADMDFRVSSYIQDAVIKQAEHGIYGYSDTGGGYFEAVAGWMKKQFDWEIEEDWLIRTPGVVFALAAAVKALTSEGDGVIIQRPVYYPFGAVIKNNNRRVVDNTLKVDENGCYSMDFEDFENKIISENVKLFILCNPQNPSGRVFGREELEKLGDICLKHNVIVVSDEIHSDLVFEGRHTVFASVKPEFAENCVVCTAPSKTFNIAGLQVSNIFVPNKKIRQAIKNEINSLGYSRLNSAGLAACEAAYRHGEEWYDAMMKYVKANMDFMYDYIQKNIPELKMRKPEGTYLVWIDFRGLGLNDKQIDDLVINKAKLWLDSGRIFGNTGRGFQRVNVACPRKLLEQAMENLEKAIHELSEEKK